MALGSACFAGTISSDSDAMMPKLSQSKLRHNWVILYWMPYDNDLVEFGELIIKMLAKGTKNSPAAVVVQSDYFGDLKMRRRTLIEGDIREVDITAKDSSDISAFSAYLDWAYQTFEAEHWAVIVVGHGGKINEISPDDQGSSYKTRKWMRVNRFANAVSRFNQATNGRVELLFFQNCNKATLEVVYEVRNCARYTLASQMALGAPNYYYEGFLEILNQPSIGGREAAIAIIKSESVYMYHTLTLVDNQALQNLPPKLSRLIQLLITNHAPAIDLSQVSTISYFDEQCCDLLNLFGYLSQNISQTSNAFTEFANFLKSSVIAHYQIGGRLYSPYFKKKYADKLSGLSLYLPENRQAISFYSSLALYQEVDLVSLYKQIISS
ncbi:hypothetical protein NIES2098_56200 [Calothrix sp. NIES-2098]|nr:hypothetical protein NIES2098_56200 [Calothrix sp. NIES-2098]